MFFWIHYFINSAGEKEENQVEILFVTPVPDQAFLGIYRCKNMRRSSLWNYRLKKILYLPE